MVQKSQQNIDKNLINY